MRSYLIIRRWDNLLEVYGLFLEKDMKVKVVLLHLMSIRLSRWLKNNRVVRIIDIFFLFLKLDLNSSFSFKERLCSSWILRSEKWSKKIKDRKAVLWFFIILLCISRRELVRLTICKMVYQSISAILKKAFVSF